MKQKMQPLLQDQTAWIELKTFEPNCKPIAVFFILAHLHSFGSAGKPKGRPRPDPPQIRVFGFNEPQRGLPL